ncbi:MAG: NUDIX hydrolase [Desulfobaccales bacterium]
MPLTVEFLKMRLALSDRCLIPPEGLQPAGVLVPVFEAAGGLSLLFTQRTMHLKDHQGQISFPGGVRDPGDHDLLATALRETHEEIGLAPEWVEILGDLEPVATVTGYFIHPFVGLIPYPYDFQLNDHEVNRLLVFPVAALALPARWGTGSYIYNNQTSRVFCWNYQGALIWGATARIVLNFLGRLDIHPLPPTLLPSSDE